MNITDIPPSPDYDDDDRDPPNEITILKGTDTAYRLVLECLACPEAWSVHLDEREVGYLRLRHGHFTARFPDHNGKMVFETTQIQGDGCFSDEKERMRNLKKAITRIHREVRKEGGKPSSTDGLHPLPSACIDL